MEQIRKGEENMKKVWKKSVAGICAAAVVLSSANIGSAVMNVDAQVVENSPASGEWYTTPEGVNVKLTVRYNGESGAAYMLPGAADGQNVSGQEITDASKAFDGDETTKVYFREKLNGWGGRNVVGDYVQVDLETPINLYKVVFNFGGGENNYGRDSKIEYKTADSEEWAVLKTYDTANLEIAEYTANDAAIENVAAIRVVNGTLKENKWLDIKEITIIEDEEVVVGQPYPVTKMTYSAGAAQGNYANIEGPIKYAFDGDTNTRWHSPWNNTDETMIDRCYVDMQFAKPTVISEVTYLPRQDNADTGTIVEYEILGKETLESEWTSITTGTWENNKDLKHVEFEPQTFTAVRLQPKKAINGGAETTCYASAAEISAIVGEIKTVEESSAIKTYSISLIDNIGVNFYANITDADVENGAKVKITAPSEDGKTTTEVEYPVADAERTTEGFYRFSGEVCAAQMTKDVTAEIIVGDETIHTATVSVKGYADSAIALLTEKEDKIEADEAQLALLKAILNYGAYSQLQFGKDTDNLANASLSEEDQNIIQEASIAEDSVPAIVNEAFADGTKPVSAISLVLETRTALRFYVSDAVTEVTYNGTALELKETAYASGKTVRYVEIEEIPAKNLCDGYDLTVSNGAETVQVTASPLNYLAANIAKEDSLGNLAKAMCQYYQKAEFYFNHVK